jgi:beta-glucosidase
LFLVLPISGQQLPNVRGNVPRLHSTGACGEMRMRLVGFQRVTLQPGRSQRVIAITDPRLLPDRFDRNAGYWLIAAALSRGAAAELAAREFGP